MPLGLALDLIVAGLLVATIWYCVVLNRRLSLLRDAQNEMQRTVQEFDRATTAARSSIIELRSVADRTGAELREQITKAAALSDELKFIADSGNRLAERLTDQVTGARRPAAPIATPGFGAGGPAPSVATAASATPATRPQPARPAPATPPPAATPADRRSEAERELMQALQRFK